jgi:hypothetical protein
MKKQTLYLSLFWIGLAIAIAFASVGTGSFMGTLRNSSMEEVAASVWDLNGPLFYLWAFAVPLGSLLAGIAAFLYAKSKPVFAWLAGIGVLGAVLVMNLLWSRVYEPILFGIGGTIILISFFAIVWIWMKTYAQKDMRTKIAGSYKLIGFLFWINASWFLCGETGKLHLKAFENDPLPSPIEIMVFLVLGWIFVLVGEYAILQSYPEDQYVGGEAREPGDAKYDLNIRPPRENEAEILQSRESDERTTILSETEITLGSG